MKYAIKTLNPDKGNIRWEIHKIGCSDLYKENAMSVHNREAVNPEELIKIELEEDTQSRGEVGWFRENWEIMPCVKNMRR